MIPRPLPILAAVAGIGACCALAWVAAQGAASGEATTTAAAQARQTRDTICASPSLGSPDKREQALTDGYVINRDYDCIERQSVLAIETAKAQWQADNTPAAVSERARQATEQTARIAADAEQKRALYEQKQREAGR